MAACTRSKEHLAQRYVYLMVRPLLLPLLFICVNLCTAQNIGINVNGAAPNASALLDIDVSALAGPKRGLLIPRVTTAERVGILSPATGLLVFDTSFLEFWFFDGLTWTPLNNGRAWKLTGNSGTVLGAHFLGTTDSYRLDFRVNNEPSGRIDHNLKNTFFGFRSGASISIGQQNTLLGAHAGEQCTSGSFNTVIGWLGAQGLTTGTGNIALGPYSLQYITSGLANIGIGTGSLRNIANGQNNTAIGESALTNTVSANGNTAVGSLALYQNTSGLYNTAVGAGAGSQNITGEYNVAMGQYAGPASGNLIHTTSIGTQSSAHANDATAVGYLGRAEGLRSSAYGYNARAVGQNSTAIGQNALANSPNCLVLGGTGANAVNVGIGVTTPTATLEVNGYTKLGSSAPAVRMLKLTGTTAATQGASVPIAHGLTAAKILSVSVLVETTAGDLISPLHPVFGFTYYHTVNATNIVVVNQAGSSGNMLSKPIRILITYEQ